MNFQEKLKELRPYVTGLRFVKDMPVVDVVFDTGWVFNEESTTIIIKESEKVKNYFMCYSEDLTVDIDTILDYVKRAILYNKEIELKKGLRTRFGYELDQLFTNMSYEKLLNLEFKFKEPVNGISSEDKKDFEALMK